MGTSSFTNLDVSNQGMYRTSFPSVSKGRFFLSIPGCGILNQLVETLLGCSTFLHSIILPAYICLSFSNKNAYIKNNILILFFT